MPLPALLLGALLPSSIAVFVVGIARVTKSSERYRLGLMAAKLDQRVIDALGAPVEDGIMPSGSISTSNGSGSANLSVSLHGARGNGTLYIEAERHAGEWHYTTLQVLPDAGEAIAPRPCRVRAGRRRRNRCRIRSQRGCRPRGFGRGGSGRSGRGRQRANRCTRVCGWRCSRRRPQVG
ncbi:cytochrome c oxidase assembly factor Coa1 family protein [Xanthomonas theicola]|uniref:cytochrome c oxidase assembly factor Coa1 family protein n=1 Tax=Xanthomonas theicola TaxID=56464 RepID=UPI001FE428CB|nr:cytochrome c oxidase assembly factor Coa1 family protein [Xanthomonas theicola]